MSTVIDQCPGDTVHSGTGKVDPVRKFKCTTADRGIRPVWFKQKKGEEQMFSVLCLIGLKYRLIFQTKLTHIE